jgi:excisionase family DNA binding protein
MDRTADLISVSQVAERLSVSRDTVRRLLAAGALGTVRIGNAVRIPLSDVDRLVARGAATTRKSLLPVIEPSTPGDRHLAGEGHGCPRDRRVDA